jgi:hypothetical protein
VVYTETTTTARGTHRNNNDETLHARKHQRYTTRTVTHIRHAASTETTARTDTTAHGTHGNGKRGEDVVRTPIESKQKSKQTAKQIKKQTKSKEKKKCRPFNKPAKSTNQQRPKTTRNKKKTKRKR